MVFCVQAHLIFADAATRDTRLTQAQAFITGKPQFGPTRLDAVTDKGGAAAIILETRYTVKGDQTAADTGFRALAGIQPGSFVQLHDCPHDEGTNACPATVTRTTF